MSSRLGPGSVGFTGPQVLDSYGGGSGSYRNYSGWAVLLHQTKNMHGSHFTGVPNKVDGWAGLGGGTLGG